MKFNRTGFIVTSILITIGADLWYTRTDFRPQPQDFAELMNGIQERCLATRFSTNGTYHFEEAGGYDVWENQPVIRSNSDYSVVHGGNDSHYFFNGTNPVPYSMPALQAVPPYTNRTQIGGPLTFFGGNDVLSFNAIALEKTFTENDPTNRWILGTFESFTISGFPETEFNGTYTRHYDTWFYDGQWYVFNVGYTNSSGCSMSPGEVETTFQNGGGWWDGSYYSMRYPPWFGTAVSDSSWSHDPPYPDFYITCTRGPLATNLFIQTVGTNTVTNAIPEKITDRPCYTKTYVYDWVLDNRKPSWDDFFGIIDRIMWGSYHYNEYGVGGPYNPDIGGWFDGFLYSPWMRPMLTQSVVSVYRYPYDHAFFIDPSKWGVSSFENVSKLELPIDSWGLTNTVDFIDGTHITKITGFDDAILLPLGYNDASGFRLSPSVNQFSKHAFDQRRAALQQCTVLRMHGGRAKWVPPNVTNNVRWSGTVWSTNGYDDVCAKAKAACTNKGTEVGAPYSYCWAQVSPGSGSTGPTRYYMAMKSRDARMVMFLDTNNQCEASTYVRATLSTANYAPVTNRFFANDSNVAILTTNLYQKIDAIPMGHHFAYSNLVVQNYNNIFPPVPVSNGYKGTKMISYSLEWDQSTEVITKWDFQHCKP